MKKSFFVLLGVSALFMTGCQTAKTRIFPREDGSNVIVASSASESNAYDAASDKGEEYCSKMGKRFVMVNQKSEYQGMDKTAKAGLGVASSVLGVAMRGAGAHTYEPEYGTYNSTHSIDDNKVTVTFKCM